MKRVLPAVFALGSLVTCNTSSAEFLYVGVETYVGDDWIANGYAGLTTYHLYIHFSEPTDSVHAVVGASGSPLSIWSSDGAFHNEPPPLGGVRSPVDLSSLNYYANQWDTFLAIDALTRDGDFTAYGPGVGAFDDMDNGLMIDNASWYIHGGDWDETDQGIAGDDLKVFIGQFTVAEGETIGGVINFWSRPGQEYYGLAIPAPGVLVITGFAGLAAARRRRA